MSHTSFGQVGLSGEQVRLLSGRQAAQVLAGGGLNRSRAQQVLAAGLAGEPIRTSSALLYDAARVQALVERPVVTWRDVAAMDLHTLFVARGEVDPRQSRLDQVRALSETWRFQLFTGVELKWRVEKFGPVPFLATVCGFVAFGAELSQFRPRALEGAGSVSEPGPWFEAFRDTRFPSGPGRPWVLWEDEPLSDYAEQLMDARRARLADARRAS
jgi:hypothetical protein